MNELLIKEILKSQCDSPANTICKYSHALNEVNYTGAIILGLILFGIVFFMCIGNGNKRDCEERCEWAFSTWAVLIAAVLLIVFVIYTIYRGNKLLGCIERRSGQNAKF